MGDFSDFPFVDGAGSRSKTSRPYAGLLFILLVLLLTTGLNHLLFTYALQGSFSAKDEAFSILLSFYRYQAMPGPEQDSSPLPTALIFLASISYCLSIFFLARMVRDHPSRRFISIITLTACVAISAGYHLKAKKIAAQQQEAAFFILEEVGRHMDYVDQLSRRDAKP